MRIFPLLSKAEEAVVVRAEVIAMSVFYARGNLSFSDDRTIQVALCIIGEKGYEVSEKMSGTIQRLLAAQDSVPREKNKRGIGPPLTEEENWAEPPEEGETL